MLNVGICLSNFYFVPLFELCLCIWEAWKDGMLETSEATCTQ